MQHNEIINYAYLYFCDIFCSWKIDALIRAPFYFLMNFRDITYSWYIFVISPYRGKF